MPKKVEHPEWFDAKQHPMRGKDGKLAYQGLVWQCRYSDVEVPDDLWRATSFGAGKPFADDRADDMLKEKRSMQAFDAWTQAFIAHLERKGPVRGIKEAERSAQTTTNQDKK
jgi:hypothetical protein